MATIPETPSLQPRSSRQQSIVTGPGSARFDPLKGVSDDINELKVVRDKNEVAKASLEFRRARAELDSEFEGRDDYEEFEEDYRKRSTEAVGALAQNITDPALREHWLMERDADVIAGQQRVAEKARAIYVDKERAGLLESMEDLLKKTGEAGQIAGNWSAVKESLDAKVASRVISAQEAQVWGEKWRVDATSSYIRGMDDPRDQLGALQEEWAKNLPAHIRKDLADRANQKIRVSEAQGVVYKYLDKGLNEADGRRAIYEELKDKDPEMVATAQQEWSKAYTSKLSSTSEARNEAYNAIHLDLGWGLHDIEMWSDPDNPETSTHWRNLTPAMRENLERLAAQKNSNTRPASSDRAVWSNLYGLMVEAGRGSKAAKLKFNDVFYNNSSELNDTDYKKFFEFVVGDDKSIVTFQTILSEAVKKLPTKAGIELQDRMGDWYDRYKEENDNLAPSEGDMRNQVKFFMSDVVGTGIWGMGQSKGYELEDLDEFESAYFATDDPEARKALLSSVSTAPAFRNSDPGEVSAELYLRVRSKEQPELFKEFLQVYKEKGGSYDALPVEGKKVAFEMYLLMQAKK